MTENISDQHEIIYGSLSYEIRIPPIFENVERLKEIVGDALRDNLPKIVRNLEAQGFTAQSFDIDKIIENLSMVNIDFLGGDDRNVFAATERLSPMTDITFRMSPDLDRHSAAEPVADLGRIIFDKFHFNVIMDSNVRREIVVALDLFCVQGIDQSSAIFKGGYGIYITSNEIDIIDKIEKSLPYSTWKFHMYETADREIFQGSDFDLDDTWDSLKIYAIPQTIEITSDLGAGFLSGSKAIRGSAKFGKALIQSFLLAKHIFASGSLSSDPIFPSEEYSSHYLIEFKKEAGASLPWSTIFDILLQKSVGSMVNLTIRLPHREREKFRQLSLQQKLTPSELGRNLIMNYVERYGT